jgi:hypothetical protein
VLSNQEVALVRPGARTRYLHKELGGIQHDFHGGPGWFVAREKLGVLLVVRRKILTFSTNVKLPIAIASNPRIILSIERRSTRFDGSRAPCGDLTGWNH